jgi:hypothetical protein
MSWSWHLNCPIIIMNIQLEELSIMYNGEPIRITPHASDTDTFLTVHLPEDDIELKVEYIDDNPCWTENGVVTQRSEQLGRLIEERDGR